MRSRRGVSIIVTGLIALVAILATTVYFISGNRLQNPAKTGPSQPANTQPQSTPTNSQNNQETHLQTSTTSQEDSGTEQVRVTNTASWVGAGPNNASTAFAIQNVGSKTVTVTDIKLRGIAVPVASWYYCKGGGAGQCATQLNVQTPLPVDFTPASVTISGTAYAMTNNERVLLSPGEAAIVYLQNAGNIQTIR